MSRFNLLDEPWLSVIVDNVGHTEEVSLKELFENAHQYKRLAGDSLTQDFVILRLLLAIIGTVFSRFDEEGEALEALHLNDKFQPLKKVDDGEAQKYLFDLENTWKNLWKKERFPTIVLEYLEKWHDRFYLFDEKYPFFQVIATDIDPEKISKAKASSVSGKNINRLISESGNKIALFSPKFDAQNNKETLNASEVARWLLTFHGYTGLSDKVIFGKQKYDVPNSKGWAYDLGGIYLQGNTLFETLLLNCVLVHPEPQYQLSVQKPCWEYESHQVISEIMSGKDVDNLAELYTNWSRAIYINPDINLYDPFTFDIVKLPEINHQDNFLEPMTLWRFNETGDNKDKFTPRKHQITQSLWRSFGLITIPHINQKKQREPGIITWFRAINNYIGDYDVQLHSISMKDDGNATSWVPTDEIFDHLCVNDFVLADVGKAGWIPRINDMVEKTKKIIGFTFRNFIMEIKQIRNLSSVEFVNQKVEELYFLIDQSFKDWLGSIRPNDLKEDKLSEWENQLKDLVKLSAYNILKEAGPRDYVGIVEDNEGKTGKREVTNIATSYNKFIYFLNKELKG